MRMKSVNHWSLTYGQACAAELVVQLVNGTLEYMELVSHAFLKNFAEATMEDIGSLSENVAEADETARQVSIVAR